MNNSRRSLALAASIILVGAASLLAHSSPVTPMKDYPIRPVPFTAVHFDDVVLGAAH